MRFQLSEVLIARIAR